MRPTERNDDTASVVGRILAVLQCFTETPALSISAIARQAGLPKTTAHRIVHALLRRGYLVKESDGIQLGLPVYELGQLVPRQRRLQDVAQPVLSDLHIGTRETVHLAIMDGTEVVYVAKLESPRGPHLPSRVGGRMPCHCTAVGKAQLASADPVTIRKILSEPLARYSQRTTTSPAYLLKELEKIRWEGVAFDRQESGEGTACAAAPVFATDGQVVAAISVSVRTAGARLDRLAPAVRTAAASLTRLMNRPGPVGQMSCPGDQGRRVPTA